MKRYQGRILDLDSLDPKPHRLKYPSLLLLVISRTSFLGTYAFAYHRRWHGRMSELVADAPVGNKTFSLPMIFFKGLLAKIKLSLRAVIFGLWSTGRSKQFGDLTCSWRRHLHLETWWGTAFGFGNSVLAFLDIVYEDETILTIRNKPYGQTSIPRQPWQYSWLFLVCQTRSPRSVSTLSPACAYDVWQEQKVDTSGLMLFATAPWLCPRAWISTVRSAEVD